MKVKIYLDFNSTHPPDRDILDAARAFYLEHYANSSGLSLASQQVNKRIEQAREEIAACFTITPQQVVFTSCATESNNLLIRYLHQRSGKDLFTVISSPFEHPSVAEVLRTSDNTKVNMLRALRDGSLDIASWPKLDWQTDLITAMAVQNESGVILPITELLHHKKAETAFLCDAAQLLPKLCPDGPEVQRPEFIRFLLEKGCFASATGHKLGAGFGCGLLLLPRTHALNSKHPLLAGGNQEHGLRAGSHNTEAIIALSLALKKKLAQNSYALWRERTEHFENLLVERLAFLPGFEIIGKKIPRAPGSTLLLLPKVPIDFLIMALDREGITVSTGTSCKSRSRTPSQALLAMGFSETEALSVIRLSYSQEISNAEIETVATALATAVKALV